MISLKISCLRESLTLDGTAFRRLVMFEAAKVAVSAFCSIFKFASSGIAWITA